MSDVYLVLVGFSFLGLVVLVLRAYLKDRNKRALVVRLVLLVLVGAVLASLFGQRFQAKGGDDPLFALVLYVCMVLGMLASYGYRVLEGDPAKRPRFDWGNLLAPVFASPIIFIPLVAALQNADIDLTSLTTPRLMVFLVAFENGFFWKEYFDKRRQGAATND